ncbi:MAG: GAF domain-containing protein [Acidobacteriota bacterium]
MTTLPTATSLPITKAARMLGVHPNTLRAWADQGRIRCLRVNSRGDRRFLIEDLRDFMAEAEPAPTADPKAQIESIARLGTRLNHLVSAADIGTAICHGLREVIEYHNVRVYRIYDDEVVPVAWHGELGAYTDEEGEQLRLRVGEGITGWVAEHGESAYLPDAMADPRGSHVPGTEEELAESLLLVPMLYEDEVIGVIVLAKLGLARFSPVLFIRLNGMNRKGNQLDPDRQMDCRRIERGQPEKDHPPQMWPLRDCRGEMFAGRHRDSRHARVVGTPDEREPGGHFGCQNFFDSGNGCPGRRLADISLRTSTNDLLSDQRQIEMMVTTKRNVGPLRPNLDRPPGIYARRLSRRSG